MIISEYKKFKPKMKKSEIRIIEKQLLELGTKGRVNILEWGSGGSTVYFTQFLKQNNIPYDWVSIEYNKNWHDKVLQLVQDDKNTNVKLFDVGNNSLFQRHVNMDEYVAYPSTTRKRFDFILVDGRKRRRCLIEAKDLLNPNGVVYLHDAFRKHYHSSFEYYPDSVFVGAHLWKGKMEQVNLPKRIIHKFVNSFYSFMRMLRKLSPIRLAAKIPFLQKIKRRFFPNLHLD
ncbi:class I SAM-dependent methyltransferase [Patescibacteria group bacterium]